MAELRNCPSCGGVFNYTGVRDVCHKCGQIEEEKYEIVYRFLRMRENRAATIERIVEATGVEEELLHKWVRKKRLHPALFPNLGYPCDNCGRLTKQGKLCIQCVNGLKEDLDKLEAIKEFRESVQQQEKRTYLSDKK